MLVCCDVQQSIAFFQDILGFEILERLDDIGLSGWASLRCGSSRIMLTSASYLKPSTFEQPEKPESDVVHYFHCDDVVKLRKHLVSRNVNVSDYFVRFYGKKEIELLDPDGRLLIFGSDTDELPTPE